MDELQEEQDDPVTLRIALKFVIAYIKLTEMK